jgi:hypothetical protein
MNDREFWLLVRRALLLVVKAIEQRWNLNYQQVCDKK